MAKEKITAESRRNILKAMLKNKGVSYTWAKARLEELYEVVTPQEFQKQQYLLARQDGIDLEKEDTE